MSKHLMPAACLLPQCIHLGPELWDSLKLLPFRERAELYSKFRVRALPRALQGPWQGAGVCSPDMCPGWHPDGAGSTQGGRRGGQQRCLGLQAQAILGKFLGAKI